MQRCIAFYYIQHIQIFNIGSLQRKKGKKEYKGVMKGQQIFFFLFVHDENDLTLTMKKWAERKKKKRIEQPTRKYAHPTKKLCHQEL